MNPTAEKVVMDEAAKWMATESIDNFETLSSKIANTAEAKALTLDDLTDSLDMDTIIEKAATKFGVDKDRLIRYMAVSALLFGSGGAYVEKLKKEVEGDDED